MINNYFVKLPRELFYNVNDFERLIKVVNYDHKIILIMDYLYTNTNRKGITILELEDLIKSCGFKPDNHKGKINDKFRFILSRLQELHIINANLELNNLKKGVIVKCSLDMFQKNDKGEDNNFIILYEKEKNKILNYDKENIDNVKLLFYYCYLKARMYKRSNEEGKSTNKYGGRAEICFPSYKTISKDTELCDDVILKYNDILTNINLIRIMNAGLYYLREDKNKVIRESPNFYTLYTEEDSGKIDEKQTLWYTNLKEGIKLYKKNNKDKVFKNNREYLDNNRSINGFIARIRQLEKEGKATKIQLKKRDSYLHSISLDPKVSRIDSNKQVANEDYWGEKDQLKP